MERMNKMQCSLSDVVLSSEPNKMIITGCITKIDEASTGIPCGPTDKPVVFTREAVEKCAATFEGSPLNCVYPDGWLDYVGDLFMGHSDTNIGFLRRVYASGNNLMSEIVIWKDRNQDLSRLILMSMDSLGFSVEWYTTEDHEDGSVRYIDGFEGCGCAILWRDAAAFSQTFIEKIAASKRKDDDTMTNEEKQGLITEITDKVMAGLKDNLADIVKAANAPLVEDVAKLSASVAEKAEAAKVEAEKAEAEKASAEMDELKAKIEAQAAEIESLKAAKAEADIPAPKAISQTVADNPLMASSDERAKEMEKINASAMTPEAKIKAITAARMKFAATKAE